MTIANVQSGAWVNNNGAAGSTVAITLGATVTSGGCVTTYVAYDSTGTLNSVTDDKSNTHNIKITTTQTTDTIKISQVVLGNITNGPKTFTANFSASGLNRAISAAEWSGVSAVSDPTDTSIGQQQNSAANPTSSNTTTTANGDLISGLCVNSSNNTVLTIGSGYTQGQSMLVFITSTAALDWEYQIQSAAGSIAATWTHTAINYAANVLTIKAATGGAAIQPPYGFDAQPPSFMLNVAYRRKSVGWTPLSDPRRRILRPRRGLLLPEHLVKGLKKAA